MGNEVIVSAAHYEPKLDIIIPCVRHADDIFMNILAYSAKNILI